MTRLTFQLVILQLGTLPPLIQSDLWQYAKAANQVKDASIVPNCLFFSQMLRINTSTFDKFGTLWDLGTFRGQMLIISRQVTFESILEVPKCSTVSSSISQHGLNWVIQSFRSRSYQIINYLRSLDDSLSFLNSN